MAITRVENFLVIDMRGFRGHYFCIPNSDTSYVTENIDYILNFELDPNGIVLSFKMDFLGPDMIFSGKYLKQD